MNLRTNSEYFKYNNPLEQDDTKKHLIVVNGLGKQKFVGDCVIRAISIACEIPYIDVQKEIQKRNKNFRETSWSREAMNMKPKQDIGMNGSFRKVYEPYLLSLGWKWQPTMGIGTGCKVHLKANELPGGRLICRVSKHLVAVIDGVIHDTYNPSRAETRCVYGYFYKEQQHDNR